MDKRVIRWTAWAVLIGGALAIRLLASRGGHPSLAGDSWHFVQHGVALANGVPGAMSTYWSQGMIALAAGGVRMGLDPRYVLQGTTILSGVLLVGLFAWVLHLLTGSLRLSYLGGWLLAVNPRMTYFSITGFSEMPYLAFLLAGVAVGLHGLRRGAWFLLGAGVLIGLSGYLKGLDAAVAAFSFGLYVMLRTKGVISHKLIQGALVPLVAFLILLPLCSFTYSRTGSFSPGSKGYSNLALGSNWADSKVVHSAEGRIWEDVTMFDLFRQMPSRIRQNAAETIRQFNGQIFARAFRMGAVWFFLLLAGVAWILWRGRVRESMLPICMLALQVFLLWLVFVHSRNLITSFPWVLALFLLAGKECWPVLERAGQTVWPLLILVIFLAVNGLYSAETLPNENYKTVAVSRALVTHGGTDEDVVMTYGPALAVEFNQTNPLKTVGMRYGTIEQLDDIARQRNVRFIIVSDTIRSHWPVARLFDADVSPPSNWVLLEELDFRQELWPGGTLTGERRRIYERQP